MFVQTKVWKFLVKFFSKNLRVLRAEPWGALRRGRNSLSFAKRRRGWISLLCKERGRTLVGGSPYIVSLCYGFYVAFLKKSSAKNFTEGKVLEHILRTTILPRVILSGTKWSRTPQECAKHRIYEGIARFHSRSRHSVSRSAFDSQ